MKITARWWLVGLVLAASFFMTMTKAPSEINQILGPLARQMAPVSLAMHLLLVAALLLGWRLPARRAAIFAGMMALLAGMAALMGAIGLLLPNLALFVLYGVLILWAYFKDQLAWDFARLGPADWFFGILGLGFGFWYLHWVDSPLMLNALLYSPLGVLNCPTMLAMAGFLCLSSRRPALLEFTSGLVTLYFGFFGIMRLGAHVDVVLVLCGLYQLIRLGGQWCAQPAAPRGELAS